MASMIRTLADRGDPPAGDPVLWTARTFKSITFREELENVREARLKLTDVVHVLADPPPGSDRRDGGCLAAEMFKQAPASTPMPIHEYFICGPDASDGCD